MTGLYYCCCREAIEVGLIICDRFVWKKHRGKCLKKNPVSYQMDYIQIIFPTL